MMRHQTSLALGLATLFVLPASLPGSQEPGDLEERLEATVEAIEYLAGIDTRMKAGETNVVSDLLEVTEMAWKDHQLRDETLVLLRVEVAALQQAWDEMTVGTARLFPLPAPTDQGSSAPTHVGLNAEDIRLIKDQSSSTPKTVKPVSDDPATLEDIEKNEVYTADALRHGRLLTRAGRFGEAAPLLEKLEEVPEASYWLARCYEGLDREGEAIELLEALVDAGLPDPTTGEDASPETRSLARRARYDLDLLTLRRDLERRSQKNQAKPEESSK